MWTVAEIKPEKDGKGIAVYIERDDYADSLDFEALQVEHFIDENHVRERLPKLLEELNLADERRHQMERRCEALRAEFGLDGKRSCERDESCCQ